jgi:hypothetical protein
MHKYQQINKFRGDSLNLEIAAARMIARYDAAA